MAYQMYLVKLKKSSDSSAYHQFADLVVRLGGFLLMRTSSGAIVIGLDDRLEAQLKGHARVAFAGSVAFDSRGQATGALQRLFAANVERQLRNRQLSIQGKSTPQP